MKPKLKAAADEQAALDRETETLALDRWLKAETRVQDLNRDIKDAKARVRALKVALAQAEWNRLVCLKALQRARGLDPDQHGG